MAQKDPTLVNKKPDELSFDALGIKKAALLLRAVNHPFRQQILRLIHQEGFIRVKAVYQRLHTIQPVASSHLAVLRKAGVVSTKREGKTVLYSINAGRIAQLELYVQQLLKTT